MLQESICPTTLADVENYLNEEGRLERINKSSSILVQIFDGTGDMEKLAKMTGAISDMMPDAVVTGVSAMGEIMRGMLMKNSCVVSFSYFETAKITYMLKDISQTDEERAGHDFRDFCSQAPADTRGGLLFCTTMTICAQRLLDAMEGSSAVFPVFGAGAAWYDNTMPTFIVCGRERLERGAVLVLFSGEELRIKMLWSGGWKPMSRAFRATDVSDDCLTVREFDGEPAINVYKKYLGIENSGRFYWDVIQFPFIVRRGGMEFARIPLSCGEDGDLRFVADVKKDEDLRIAYGDHEKIMSGAESVQIQMREFRPQGISVYNCGSRRIFFGPEADRETLPFEDICPTSGFYTCGEIAGSTKRLLLQNMTMVAVGMREGRAEKHFVDHFRPTAALRPEDGSTALEVRLMHFIKALAAEYEEQNRELKYISEHDRLTGLYNRGVCETSLTKLIDELGGGKASALLTDTDHFKKINENYGHYTGDRALAEVSRVLASGCGRENFIGRWGGDGFLILLPGRSGEEAEALADELRLSVARHDFLIGESITTSIGVTQIRYGDTMDSVYQRADSALSEAKRGGRDRVVRNG